MQRRLRCNSSFQGIYDLSYSLWKLSSTFINCTVLARKSLALLGVLFTTPKSEQILISV